MGRSTGVNPNPTAGNPDLSDPVGAAHRRADAEGSEYGWGAGLTPPGLENAGPAEGGRYHTRVPGRKIRD